jgi:hypothetical protein
MTHRKRIANWMARELIPSLAKKNGSAELWCNDCHDGKAKILGNPRNDEWAVEWMLTHLVSDFNAAGGEPLRCKACHGGNLGTPEFSRKVILNRLRADDAGATETAPDAGASHAGVSPSEAGADAGP